MTPVPEGKRNVSPRCSTASPHLVHALYPLVEASARFQRVEQVLAVAQPSASHPAMQVPSKPMTLDRALPLTRSRLSFPETVSTPNPATTAVNRDACRR